MLVFSRHGSNESHNDETNNVAFLPRKDTDQLQVGHLQCLSACNVPKFLGVRIVV